MVNRKEGNLRERDGHKSNFLVKTMPDPLPKKCQMTGGICVDMLEAEEVKKVKAADGGSMFIFWGSWSVLVSVERIE